MSLSCVTTMHYSMCVSMIDTTKSELKQPMLLSVSGSKPSLHLSLRALEGCPNLACPGVQTFAVIMDEFGSTFENDVERQCFSSIVAYMNNAGDANDRQHASIKSWFYW